MAASPAYAWPAVRLNQFNWSVAIFAAHAAVNGDSATLAAGLGRHLDAFLGAAARNLGPGLALPLPAQSPGRGARTSTRPSTRTSCSSFARHYGAARRAGMRPPRAPRFAARLGAARARGRLDARADT